MPGEDGPFISIIIPVYNVEKYLHDCVDSVLCQAFRDYELILVNDGSSDRCPAICDEYAAVDGRIKVIHKENGGASDARNAGIRAAVGTYLLFIDSDDYIADGSLGKIADHIKKDGICDIIFLNAVGVLPNGSFTEFAYSYDKNMVYKKNRDVVLEYFTSISQFPVSPCIKLMRRQLVTDKNLYFTKGIVCEDLDQMIGLILSAESFNCFDFDYYYYRCFRENSVSSSNQDRLFHGLLTIIRKWYGLSKNDNSEQATVIHKILAYEYCPLLWLYHSLDKSEKVTYKKEMKKYAKLMSISNDKRVILTNIVYKLLGLHIVSKLLNFYYVLKFNARR